MNEVFHGMRIASVQLWQDLRLLTNDQTPTGRLNESEQVIQQSLGVWTNVAGSSLNPNTLAPLTRVKAADGCGSDGLNSICFDQPDMAFTPGVLAFTTVDAIAIQVGSGAPSSKVGQNDGPGWACD